MMGFFRADRHVQDEGQCDGQMRKNREKAKKQPPPPSCWVSSLWKTIENQKVYFAARVKLGRKKVFLWKKPFFASLLYIPPLVYIVLVPCGWRDQMANRIMDLSLYQTSGRKSRINLFPNFHFFASHLFLSSPYIWQSRFLVKILRERAKRGYGGWPWPCQGGCQQYKKHNFTVSKFFGKRPNCGQWPATPHVLCIHVLVLPSPTRWYMSPHRHMSLHWCYYWLPGFHNTFFDNFTFSKSVFSLLYLWGEKSPDYVRCAIGFLSSCPFEQCIKHIGLLPGRFDTKARQKRGQLFFNFFATIKCFEKKVPIDVAETIFYVRYAVGFLSSLPIQWCIAHIFIMAGRFVKKARQKRGQLFL